MIDTITILKENFGLFKEKIEIFQNKIRHKINYNVVKEEYKYDEKLKGKIGYLDISIDIPDFKEVVPGYKLVGVAEYKNADRNEFGGDYEGITHVFDEAHWKEVEKYRNTKNAKCDHCGVNRYRSSVLIIYNEDKQEYLCVGSSCVKDFLGIDYNPYLLFSKLERFINVFEEYDRASLEKGYKRIIALDLYEIVAVALFFIDVSKEKRYVSKKESEAKGIFATSEYVLEYYYNYDSMKKDYGSIYDILFKYGEKAKHIINIVKNNIDIIQEGSYKNNIITLINTEANNIKYTSMVVSIIGIYNMIERKKKEKEENSNTKEINKKQSEYINASIGSKIEIPLTVINIRKLETDYGITTMYIFNDDNENVLIWFSSKDVGLEKGNKYNIKGTVKNFKEYNGAKQTILTRCKVV